MDQAANILVRSTAVQAILGLWDYATSVRRSTLAQTTQERRNVERPETVMVKPADVGLEESAQIRHAIFQHREAVDSDAPGETLINAGIEAAISQDIRMHHAAAQNLEPILALAKAHLASLARALDIDFHRRLGERKITRPEPHLDVRNLEKGFAGFFENPFEMAKMRGAVDDEALDLMKHRRMSLVGIAAIDAPRANDPDRRLLRQHRAHLHGARMRA